MSTHGRGLAGRMQTCNSSVRFMKQVQKLRSNLAKDMYLKHKRDDASAHGIDGEGARDGATWGYVSTV